MHKASVFVITHCVAYFKREKYIELQPHTQDKRSNKFVLKAAFLRTQDNLFGLVI